jgi:hypothetical protein
VSGTQIFGRVDGAEQLLVYQMTFGAADDIAMVLPLPVAQGHGETAVRFIDLSTFPKFFDALSMLFPSDLELLEQSAGRGMLEVHRVGAFEASYVPSIADFARLDARFRLAPAVWEALPAYRDYGFAVFKLFRPKRGLLERIGLRKVEPVGPEDVHPMAFAFKTRMLDRIFFPTVHVHDGSVHAEAIFDHTLYCQRGFPPGGWERSERKADQWTRDVSQGVIAPDFVYRREIHGSAPNEAVTTSD